VVGTPEDRMSRPWVEDEAEKYEQAKAAFADFKKNRATRGVRLNTAREAARYLTTSWIKGKWVGAKAFDDGCQGLCELVAAGCGTFVTGGVVEFSTSTLTPLQSRRGLISRLRECGVDERMLDNLNDMIVDYQIANLEVPSCK
jgi:hypothetical protein